MRKEKLVVLLAGLSLALITLVAAPRANAYLSDVTGEESLLEGLKGVGALALLQLQGPELELDPYAPARNLDVPVLGVNVFAQLEADPTVVERTFRVLGDAGIAWARQEFPWEDIEIHGRGDFQDRRNEPWRSAWDKYDHIVESAAAHDVRLLVRLDNPPDWAFADPAAAGEKGPPDDLADFNRFAAVVAERYCHAVRHYQVWNEPNIYPEWGERDVDPAAYAELLAGAAAAIRGACPDAVIVSAALAPTTEPGGRNMHDLEYLEALYAAEWADDFDVLAVQGFGLWTGPSDQRASPDRTNFSRPLLARDIMVRSGDAAKPIWITEMGWNSPPADLEVDRGKYGVTSEAERARYTVEAFDRMQTEWPWAGVGFVWMFRRPDWEWHTRPEGYFRLVEPDWRTTPAFEAVSEMAERPPVLYWGRHLPSDPAFVFSGPWRKPRTGENPMIRVGGADAEVAFGFRGKAVEVVLEATEGPPPTLFVVVDGETATLQPEPREDRWVVRQAGLDDDASHMGIVRVDDGEARFAEVIVEGDADRVVWLPAIAIALLAAGWTLWLGLAAMVALRGRARVEAV